MKLRQLLPACVLLLAAAQAAAQEWFVGGDISLLPRYEQVGQAYYRSNGLRIPDMLQYLKSSAVGWNAQRVRLFVDPSGDADPAVCQDLDYVTALGKRIKEAGFAFMLDFHYSDTWADPAHQTIPAAWQGLTATQMATRLYEYTKASLEHLVEAGVTPDFIQVGNEITCGMLWDLGRVNATGFSNWNAFRRFLNQGIKACREVCPDAKIIIHFEHIQDAAYTVDNYKKLTTYGVDFDILGLSYYPFWHKDLATLGATLDQLQANFPTKDVHIVETAYYYQSQPATGRGIDYDYSAVWPVSPEGQARFTADLITELKRHDNVKGLFWWFPEENGTGSNNSVLGEWINRGLWDNTSHRALPALLELKAFVERPDDAVEAPQVRAAAEGEWFTVQGTRLDAEPARQGVYIHGDRKVVLKE